MIPTSSPSSHAPRPCSLVPEVISRHARSYAAVLEGALVEADVGAEELFPPAPVGGPERPDVDHRPDASATARPRQGHHPAYPMSQSNNRNEPTKERSVRTDADGSLSWAGSGRGGSGLLGGGLLRRARRRLLGGLLRRLLRGALAGRRALGALLGEQLAAALRRDRLDGRRPCAASRWSRRR